MRKLAAVLGAAVLITGVPMGSALATDPQPLEQAEPIPAGEAQTVTGGCDVKVRVREILDNSPPGPLVDDLVEVLMWQEVTLYGSGFPPLEFVLMEFRPIGQPGHTHLFPASSTGSVMWSRQFLPYNFADPPPRDWLITARDPAPGGCSDSVDMRLLPATPLTDTDGVFHREIVWLYRSGITGGCTPTLFCPKDPVTREQMASFLARALNLPATSINFFTDDDTSIHEGAINRLAAAGITGGCAPGLFCPKDPVHRDQMASFLARALKLPATNLTFFTDVQDNIHEGAINRLAASGITGGCNARVGWYCPKMTVTREQMAAFIYRGFAP
jgi:hypothetical protein